MPHKLLLADDSVTIQRVIELTFADEDVQVIAVGNGQQAIERAERDRPDIVLADVGMPERDGYEVAAFIKGNPALKHVPVILLTGAFEPIDETRARAVGCDGVLVKPFEPQMVISRVKDLLAGRRPAGMWGAAPAPQGPVRQAADAGMPTSAAPAAAAGTDDPLEAYFDRLDAAFASAGTEAAPAPETPFHAPPPAPPRSDSIALSSAPPVPAPRAAAPAPSDDLGAWDPDIEGDPARPAGVEAAPPQSHDWAPAPAIPPAPAAPAVTAAPAAARAEQPRAPFAAPPSLVDAFAALLAAEQQTGIASSAAPGGAAADERLIETIAERVLARLSDQSIRPTVLDVAERLVREEIDRIKSNS